MVDHRSRRDCLPHHNRIPDLRTLHFIHVEQSHSHFVLPHQRPHHSHPHHCQHHLPLSPIPLGELLILQSSAAISSLFIQIQSQYLTVALCHLLLVAASANFSLTPWLATFNLFPEHARFKITYLLFAHDEYICVG